MIEHKLLLKADVAALSIFASDVKEVYFNKHDAEALKKQVDAKMDNFREGTNKYIHKNEFKKEIDKINESMEALIAEKSLKSDCKSDF